MAQKAAKTKQQISVKGWI